MLRIQSPELYLLHPQAGALFETYVSNMVYAIIKSLPGAPAVHHWRSVGGAEVDIVLQAGNALYPIEVKMKSVVGKYEVRGIKAFQEAYAQSGLKVMPGVIVYAGNDCHWVTDTVIAVPWNMMVEG